MIHAKRAISGYYTAPRLRLCDRTTTFILGVILGLFLALWWRAAQIRQAECDKQLFEITSGMLPDHTNP